MKAEGRFSRNYAIKRVRKAVMTDPRWKDGCRGMIMEIQHGRAGWITKLADFPDDCLAFDSEFHVMISSRGEWAELQDMMLINIGNPNVEAFIVDAANDPEVK